MRVCLAGERKVDVAWELGYRDGGSVLQVVKRIEALAQRNPGLSRRLKNYRSILSSVES